jgi:carbonic anhydrase/acetyltransferase-like protein (isoleucine patch superfamily)
MPLFELDGHRVAVPAGGRCWVAETAVLVGRVVIEEDASVWFGTVARGDNEPLVIGARTNVQDGCILHADPGFPLTIGPDATVGHGVILHGCSIGRGALIGMGAIVLNGANIGEECLVGAGALIPEGKQIPPRSVVLGSPGKIVREVNERDLAMMRSATQGYVDRWQAYVQGCNPQQRCQTRRV